MKEKITPIRVKSKRQVKRKSLVGKDALESAYNTRVNKRKSTKINDHITFTPSR
jgi:hypothetical protein